MSPPKRYCTMPKIPFFRKWFEGKFGDLCKAHDEEYCILVASKITADFDFARQVALRGHVWLAIACLIAFRLPGVGR